MKRILLFLFISVSLSVNSQSYKPLLEDNKYWDVIIQDPPQICSYAGGFRYFINGDTIINNKEYKKIYSYSYLSDYVVFCPPFTIDTDSVFTGILLREDTIEKKVWKYDSTNSGCAVDSELLIYNFNYQTADTIEPYIANLNMWCNVNIVDSVVYESFNGINRKVIYFTDITSGMNLRMIEGIGGSISGGGLFHKLPRFEGGYLLDCVKQNNINLYSEGSCHDFITKKSELINGVSIKVYPNPTSDLLYIEGKNILSVELYNLDGICHYKQIVNQSKSGNNKFTFNLKGETGLKLVKIHTNKGLIVKKVIVK